MAAAGSRGKPSFSIWWPGATSPVIWQLEDDPDIRSLPDVWSGAELREQLAAELQDAYEEAVIDPESVREIRWRTATGEDVMVEELHFSRVHVHLQFQSAEDLLQQCKAMHPVLIPVLDALTGLDGLWTVDGGLRTAAELRGILALLMRAMERHRHAVTRDSVPLTWCMLG
ncbi:unnamed protein product, partial [Symbiodinium sp. CCMP2456]